MKIGPVTALTLECVPGGCAQPSGQAPISILSKRIMMQTELRQKAGDMIKMMISLKFNNNVVSMQKNYGPEYVTVDFKAADMV